MTNERSLFKNQDYNKLKKDCLQSGELFFDELFQYNLKDVMWLRPKNIVHDPRFYVGGASRFDVIQGDNSDCWLLVAMANLTMNPTLFHHVVPKDQSFTENYAGIFHFNIWQCGKWMDVVVDDRLPTKESNLGTRKLKFVHSKEVNEFWSALLEKAYAKLYGSYDELTSGWFSEAMVDFTGGIVERVQLSLPPENLGTIITKALEKSSFMCVFMLDNPSVKEMILENGLVKGHAYSVTKAQTVAPSGQSVLLVRLRNPWGKIEWNGAWSDSSREWDSVPLEEKKRIGLVSDNDGEFWMSLSDFSKNFEHIEICHLTPDLFNNADGAEKIGWESHAFRGEWTKGVTAGGFLLETFHLNPQYRIVLTDTDDDSDSLCTVLVGLLQRNKSRKVWHKIGFTAFLLEGPEKESNKPLSRQYIDENFENSLSSDFRERRENVVRDKWDPGVYCIVPSTYKPQKEGQFLLRFFSEKKASMEEKESSEECSRQLIDGTNDEDDEAIEKIQITKTPRGKKVLKRSEQEVSRCFQKIAGNKKEIDWEGLQSVLEYALTNANYPKESCSGILSRVLSWASSIFSIPQDKIFTKSECRNMIAVLDDDHSGRLSFTEFEVLWRKLQYWESVFASYSNKSNYMDATELSKALKEAGYSLKSRDISRLVRRYSDKNGKLAFDDFVMCSIDLLDSGAS